MRLHLVALASSILGGAAIAAAVPGCSGEDPNELTSDQVTTAEDLRRRCLIHGDDDDGWRARCGTLDAGTTQDSGSTTQDSGTTTKDSGTTTQDSGTTTKDSGTTTQDSGTTSTCINAVTSPGSGHHNAGQDCLGCHANLGTSLRWTVAGTLYNAASGGSAVSGATIEVVDATGKTFRLATSDNGNFYTTQAMTFPLKARASKCPSDQKMISSATSGSCNSCHNSSMRIHLP